MKKRIILALLIPIMMLVAAVLLTRYIWCIASNPPRAWRMAIALDATTNVAANGTWGKTISYRSARAAIDGAAWGRWLCAALDELDHGHCARALTDPKQNFGGSHDS